MSNKFFLKKTWVNVDVCVEDYDTVFKTKTKSFIQHNLTDRTNQYEQ